MTNAVMSEFLHFLDPIFLGLRLGNPGKPKFHSVKFKLLHCVMAITISNTMCFGGE